MPEMTIIVKVTVPDDYGKDEGFRFVEDALSEYFEKHEDLAPESIHISTPDGTRSVML